MRRRFPTSVIAGVLWDLRDAPCASVARTWGISKGTIRGWQQGVNRPEAQPVQWPGDEASKLAWSRDGHEGVLVGGTELG